MMRWRVLLLSPGRRTMMADSILKVFANAGVESIRLGHILGNMLGLFLLNNRHPQYEIFQIESRAFFDIQ